LSVLLGGGDGSFAPPEDSALPRGEHSVALGDVDGDGKLDLVTTNRNGSASVWQGNGDGSFAPRLYSLAGNSHQFNTGDVVVGDVDGDGDQDIVTANYYVLYSGQYGRSSTSVFLSNGDGSFAARRDYALPGWALSVALGDVDGDGNVDIVTANWGSPPSTPPSFSVLLGKGDGSFAAPVNTPNPGLSGSVTLGDVDGDGDLDMVTEYRSRYSSGVSTAFLLGNGDGSFAAPLVFPSSRSVMALRDLDGDGDLDLLTDSSTSSSSVAVSLGHGDGSFAAPVDYGLPGRWGFSVALGDVDSDGDIDIVTREFGSSSSGSSASVLLNQGDGSFGPRLDYALPSDGAAVALGDVDRDGDLDIVTANYNDSASILLGNGDGSFAAQGDYRLPWRPREMALGDIDGDGDADIVTMSPDYWLMLVQLNRLG